MAEKQIPNIKAPPVEKRVEKPVVKTPGIVKGTPGGKFSEAMGTSDAKSVGHYVVNNVIKPTAKELLYNIIWKGVREWLYPGQKGVPGDKSTNSIAQLVSYHKMYNADQQGVPPETPKVSALNRDIILNSQEDAEAVYNAVQGLIERYHKCRVADLYELCEYPVSHTDNNYGWVSMAGMKLVPMPDGHVWFKTPKAFPLDEN